jgi:hypothetical protein
VDAGAGSYRLGAVYRGGLYKESDRVYLRCGMVPRCSSRLIDFGVFEAEEDGTMNREIIASSGNVRSMVSPSRRV